MYMEERFTISVSIDYSSSQPISKPIHPQTPTHANETNTTSLGYRACDRKTLHPWIFYHIRLYMGASSITHCILLKMVWKAKKCQQSSRKTYGPRYKGKFVQHKIYGSSGIGIRFLCLYFGATPTHPHHQQQQQQKKHTHTHKSSSSQTSVFVGFLFRGVTQTSPKTKYFETYSVKMKQGLQAYTYYKSTSFLFFLSTISFPLM